jgi:hypothetical protein
MSSTLFADVTPLLEAVAASDEATVIANVLDLLGPQRAQPARIAGSVGLAALWGGADPHALGALSVAGLLSRWIQGIPLGPEPESEARRKLAPALPLVQGFLAVARWVRGSLAERQPRLPEPLFPSAIQHPGGPLGLLREAIAKRDSALAQRILLGYHATGADYRSLLATLYGALDFRYPEGGHSLISALAGARVLDMADWGGNMSALLAWYIPHLMDAAPDAAPAQAARAYAVAPGHDLSWLRTRIAIPQEGAAGSDFQHALFAGDASAACDALLAALKGGATPAGVAAGMALAVAGRINAAPQGDRATLMRAGHALQYVNAVHYGMAEVQDPHVWPVLYTAAAAVNTLRAAPAAALEPGVRPAPVSAGGGTIAATMLRSLDAQLGAGDAAGALATARRYMMMGHEPRAIAGILGGVAAMRDTASDAPEALHTMPMVVAAADEYLRVPPALWSGGQNPLLGAAIRLASELRGPHTVADSVRAAIEAQLATVPR